MLIVIRSSLRIKSSAFIPRSFYTWKEEQATLASFTSPAFFFSVLLALVFPVSPHPDTIPSKMVELRDSGVLRMSSASPGFTLLLVSVILATVATTSFAYFCCESAKQDVISPPRRALLGFPSHLSKRGVGVSRRVTLRMRQTQRWRRLHGRDRYSFYVSFFSFYIP